jgi:cellulose synthase/poly-beta-1,6-N-acetylglucosamine synthase-like glycosyltransferase
MFHNFWKIILTLQDGAYIFITIVLLLFWFISIINLLFSKTIKVNSIDTKIPTNLEDKISVLIPARNEESKIGFLLESLSMQTYKNIEIHILDDNSDDNTFSVIQEYQNKFANIKVYKGQKLPNSWTGKNWACYQLSQKATSEILLFVDADIILNQSAIELLMNRFKENDVGLLSVFPTQIMKTFGEFLIVPLMNYILLSMLPLTLVLKSNRKSLLAANGQLMLWKKSTYQKIGGHFSVKDQVVEDIELAKKIKQNKEKVLTLLGGNYIFCRMYNSFFESINGFSKKFLSRISTTFYTFPTNILYY